MAGGIESTAGPERIYLQPKSPLASGQHGGGTYLSAAAQDAGLYCESQVALLPYEYSDEVLEDQTVESSARFVAYKDGRVKVNIRCNKNAPQAIGCTFRQAF